MCFQAVADVWLLTCLLVGVRHAVSLFDVEHLLRPWESSGSPWALRKQAFSCSDIRILRFVARNTVLLSRLVHAVHTFSNQGGFVMTAESWPAALAATQVAGLTDHPCVLLVDIRPRRQYFRGHILGSQSIPSGLLLAGEVPDGDLVLIGRDSDHGASVVEALHDQGYTRRISYLDGGFRSWQQNCGQVVNRIEIGRFHGIQQLIGAPVLLLAGAFTQSLGLFGLGFMLLVGPWAIAARSRA